MLRVINYANYLKGDFLNDFTNACKYDFAKKCFDTMDEYTVSIMDIKTAIAREDSGKLKTQVMKLKEDVIPIMQDDCGKIS